MERKRKAMTVLAVLVIILGLIMYPKLNKSPVIAGGEIYQVGETIVVLNGVGSTTVGNYDNPIPEGPGVREIVLGYTCIGTDVLLGEVLPSFAEYWEEKTGEKVRFTTGWNAIGIDSVATSVYGKPIQVLILTSNLNGSSRGYSQTKWKQSKQKDKVYSYPYVFLVREGNPLNIRTYEDLARPEVEVVHIDPLGTHGGMSTVFALYGSALKKSEEKIGRRDYAAADEFLQQVESKAITRFGGGAAGKLFAEGVGDVLITIEPKAMVLAANNPSYEMVIPPNTIITDLYAYTMKKNIPKKDRELIDEFVDFLFHEESQEAFAQAGYRPSDPDVLARHSKFAPLPGVFGMEYLGEPTKMKKELILDKWLEINNNAKPKHERIKSKKLPLDYVLNNPELSVQQALPDQ